MKKAVFNIIVISLFAFCFFGCATQGSKTGAEVWRDVKSPNDFVGKWEGSIVQGIPENPDSFMPETSIEISIAFEYIQGADMVNGIMKVDLAQFLTDWSNMSLLKPAGITIDSLWDVLLEEFSKTDEIDVGGEYFVTKDLSDKANTFFTDEAGKLQINESGNKMKLVFYEAVSFGLGDSGFTEILLDKK
jgi:hypothetical protein